MPSLVLPLQVGVDRKSPQPALLPLGFIIPVFFAVSLVTALGNMPLAVESELMGGKCWNNLRDRSSCPFPPARHQGIGAEQVDLGFSTGIATH